MHFLLTRPEEDNQKLANILVRLNHKVSCEPLLNIIYYENETIKLHDFQAVLFTSANGVRALSKNGQDRNIPCYTVGDATAAEAKQAGFKTITSAAGNIHNLAEIIIKSRDPKNGPLLHISGKDMAGDLGGVLRNSGFSVTQHQLYKAVKTPHLSQKTKDMITAREITHIPFYSPRTAKIFSDLIQSENLSPHLTKMTAVCLSSAVSDMINSLSWHKIVIAKQPNQFNLFNMIGITLEDLRQ